MTAAATHEVTGQPLQYEPDGRFQVASPRLTFYLPDETGYDGHTGYVVQRGAHPPVGADEDTVKLLLQTGALVWVSDDLPTDVRLGRRVG